MSTMKHDLAVSIIMMVVAGFFTLCAVLSLFLLKRVSGGCCASCKTQGSPSPWGGHLSPAFSMGDVHHYSSCVSWVLRAPAALPRLWVGGQTGWGS